MFGRGPGTTFQTQTTQLQLGEPEAGQTEQDRHAENTTLVQQKAKRKQDARHTKQARSKPKQATRKQETC